MFRPLILAAALLAPAAATAATVTFSDLAAYDAALGTPSTIGETFTGNSLNGTVVQQILGSLSFRNDRLQGIAGGAGGGAARQTTTLVFATPVTAFAATIANLTGAELATILLDGVQAATLVGGSTFFGIQSTRAFSAITFLDATFPALNTQFAIDNLRVAPVPVAAAAPMLLGGLGLMAGLRRRRRG